MAINDTVQVHSIIEFSEQVHVRVQQAQSRLRPYVKEMSLKGKAAAYDGIGTIELGELSGRYNNVVFSELEHWRRKITKKRFGAALPIDGYDLNERLTNPESGYADALAMAAKRQMDRVIVAAMFADVKTGEDFENTVTYANDGGLTVDCTAGLTYEKLLEIHRNFIDGDVGNDNDVSMVMGITGDEHTALMSELELTNSDYSRQMVVDGGSIQKAAGINLVKFADTGANGADPILPIVGGNRTSFCMVQGAICMAINMDWSIKVQDRNDKYSTKQVIIEGVLGAVRTEGKLIQKVTFTP